MPKASRAPLKLSGNTQSTILTVLLIVAAFYLGMLTQKVSNLEKNQTAPAGTAAAQPSGAPAPGAKVTVIEFADFQCPFCEQWFKTVEPSLIKDYVDTGKVKFAFRQYAFLGQESTWAAEAAECANEQGKFWDFHDYLYNHQGQENSGTFSKANLEGFAATLGLNTSQFNQCLETDKYAKAVSDEFAEGQKAGVQGTPATFVDGQLVSGAQPYTAFKTLIDSELAK